VPRKHWDIEEKLTYASETSVYLNLNHLSLDDFGLFFYPHADAAPESLSESFGFGHGEGEDFAGGDHGERDVWAKGLRHACRDLVILKHGAEEGGDPPIAIAVLPVEGGPANSMARPAILPSWTILRIMPAALRALAWPTMPWAFLRGSSLSSRPSPRMWEWAPANDGLLLFNRERKKKYGTNALHFGDVAQFCVARRYLHDGESRDKTRVPNQNK
jgi:hypothetical protein